MLRVLNLIYRQEQVGLAQQFSLKDFQEVLIFYRLIFNKITKMSG